MKTRLTKMEGRRHGERIDWMVRTKMILYERDKNFELFDRFAQFNESKGRSLDQLLEEFAKLCSANLSELSGFRILKWTWTRRAFIPIRTSDVETTSRYPDHS